MIQDIQKINVKHKDRPKRVGVPSHTGTDPRSYKKKAKNSKALGPDNLSPVMVKNLGPHANNFLTNIFNICMKSSNIPSIWKLPSYRLASLLPPAIKILEALLLPICNKPYNLPTINTVSGREDSPPQPFNPY